MSCHMTIEQAVGRRQHLAQVIREFELVSGCDWWPLSQHNIGTPERSRPVYSGGILYT